MRYLLFVCLLFGAFAYAQETQSPAVPPEYRPPSMRDDDESVPTSASKVTPGAAVITIKGLCPQSPPTSTGAANPDCKTIITRAQFEKLSDALLANMKPSRKRQLAKGYPDLLAMAREAEARGLENSQHFQERLAFARVQILSQELLRQIDEQSANISDKDIEDYYRAHADLFQTATLERIFVPSHKRGDLSSKPSLQAQGSEAADSMAKIANDLRAKAVAGEPFLTLEKEAYEAAAMTDVPPNPSLGRIRTDGVPPGHVAVFDMKPGEVSQVFMDSSGYYIYKVDAKENVSLDAAKPEIQKTLQKQRREEAIQTVQRGVTAEFDEAYFGSLEKPNHPEASKSK